ncbi:hypothetical protein [Pseudoduganella sp. UC29_71]|jgi:hypothetical protein|uniref:hypothetical protein n=1 Tax=Pseudoduganella sp. UC29_71 TaxID=3350174 RepID=UPI003671E327
MAPDFIQAHRAPDPVPVDDPMPEPVPAHPHHPNPPVPQDDPVPDHNPSYA